jgi:hypothetical protein
VAARVCVCVGGSDRVCDGDVVAVGLAIFDTTREPDTKI